MIHASFKLSPYNNNTIATSNVIFNHNNNNNKLLNTLQLHILHGVISEDEGLLRIS